MQRELEAAGYQSSVSNAVSSTLGEPDTYTLAVKGMSEYLLALPWVQAYVEAMKDSFGIIRTATYSRVMNWADGGPPPFPGYDAPRDHKGFGRADHPRPKRQSKGGLLRRIISGA